MGLSYSRTWKGKGDLGSGPTWSEWHTLHPPPSRGGLLGTGIRYLPKGHSWGAGVELAVDETKGGGSGSGETRKAWGGSPGYSLWGLLSKEQAHFLLETRVLGAQGDSLPPAGAKRSMVPKRPMALAWGGSWVLAPGSQALASRLRRRSTPADGC